MRRVSFVWKLRSGGKPVVLATLPACGEAFKARRGCASAAGPQGAARNPAQIVRCAPDWWRLPRSAVLRARKGPSARSARKGGPCSRCATRKRSLGVAFPAPSARAARVPRTAAFNRLLMAAIIPPCRAPRALTAGFQTLPQGRLRKPSAHHPDGLARYALRRTNRRSYGLLVAMILPCARRRGRANRSLRLAPAG